MIELSRETTPHQLDQIIRQRTGQVSARTDIGNDLQPRTNEGNAETAERARDVQVFAAGFAAERRRDERGVWNRRREDSRHQNEVAENDAGTGDRTRVARDFEDARTDENADQR